jgi:hypothetical protein
MTVIKFFITGCCDVVMLLIYKYLYVSLMISNCVVSLSGCCNTCCCSVMRCDVVVLHMYVYAAGCTVSKLFTWVAVVESVCRSARH